MESHDFRVMASYGDADRYDGIYSNETQQGRDVTE